jgi:hypothetical protein
MATIHDLETRLAALEARLGPVPQAVPPITVGELTTVPAPGAPIASQWANDVTRRAVHRFANVAARDSAYPAASSGTGAVCVTTDTGTFWEVIAGAWVAVAWGRYGMQWQRATALSCANATFVPLVFDTQVFPATGTAWGAVPNATVTVPAGGTGMYDVTIVAAFAAAAIGADSCIRLAAGGITYLGSGVGGGNAGALTLALASVPLAAGNTLAPTVLQTSGAALNLVSAFMTVTRTGPIA